MTAVLRSVLLALALVLVAPGLTASAHDELLTSEPADGAVLDTAPEHIRLTFSGQIAQIGAQVAVTGPTDPALRGTPRIEGMTLVQDLEQLAPGDYEVLWRVTSSDGHPISGAFSFEVTAQAAGPAPTEEAATQDPTETTATEAAGTAEATTEAAEETAAPTQDRPDVELDQPDQTEDRGDGIPLWVWGVVALAVLALGGLLARTWMRGRA